MNGGLQTFFQNLTGDGIQNINFILRTLSYNLGMFPMLSRPLMYDSFENDSIARILENLLTFVGNSFGSSAGSL